MGSVIFLVFCTIITFCHQASLRLGIPTCMVLCAEKDIWHKAISRRQQVMQEHESMARTAFQMSAELVSLKASVLRKSVVIDLFFPDFLRGFLPSSSLQAMLESVENRRLQDSEVAAHGQDLPHHNCEDFCEFQRRHLHRVELHRCWTCHAAAWLR